MKKIFLILIMSLSTITSSNAYEIGKGDAICSNLGFDFITSDSFFNEVHPLAVVGNANAQCMLGLMYYGGYGGVLQSYFDALAWFYIAAQGDLAIAKIHYLSTYVYLLENDFINPDEDKLYIEKGKWSTMMREVYESSLSSEDERRLSKLHWEGQELTRYLPVEYK